MLLWIAEFVSLGSPKFSSIDAFILQFVSLYIQQNLMSWVLLLRERLEEVK